MKRKKKLKCLEDSMGTYDLCQCIFDYDRNFSWYYYIMDFSDVLLLGVDEYDFLLNGFQIRKVSDLRKIKVWDDIHTQINRENKILSNVRKTEIDLTSWKTALESLKKCKCFVIIQNESSENGEDFFYLGRIKKVKKSKVIFTHYDANGSIQDNIEIPFSEITSITFGDRYSRTWEEYISKSFRFTYEGR